MRRLYADEDFDYPVVEELRRIGHDVLTAQEAGQANRSIPDETVLAFAAEQGRAVISFNRRDFIQLQCRESGGLTFASKTGIMVGTSGVIREDPATGLETATVL